jgi:hypothetical protein
VPILPVDTLFVRVCNTLTVSVELVAMMTPSPWISALAFRFLSSSDSDLRRDGEPKDIAKSGEVVRFQAIDSVVVSVCCLVRSVITSGRVLVDSGPRDMLDMAHLGFVDNIGKRNQIISPRAAYVILRSPPAGSYALQGYLNVQLGIVAAIVSCSSEQLVFWTRRLAKNRRSRPFCSIGML